MIAAAAAARRDEDLPPDKDEEEEAPEEEEKKKYRIVTTTRTRTKTREGMLSVCCWDGGWWSDMVCVGCGTEGWGCGLKESGGGGELGWRVGTWEN